MLESLNGASEGFTGLLDGFPLEGGGPSTLVLESSGFPLCPLAYGMIHGSMSLSGFSASWV